MAAKWRREDVLSSVTYATTYLGYMKLKPPQKEIITEYVLGKDVFVSPFLQVLAKAFVMVVYQLFLIN